MSINTDAGNAAIQEVYRIAHQIAFDPRDFAIGALFGMRIAVMAPDAAMDMRAWLSSDALLTNAAAAVEGLKLEAESVESVIAAWTAAR